MKLLERSECGRPATLKKEKEINAVSHGYSGADCRGNERNAETDRGGQLAEERHRGASLDRVVQVLDRWTTQQAQQPVARLVDTRGIGRPSNFGSGEEKSLEKSFPVWQRKMQNYIINVFPDLRALINSSTNDSAQKQIPRIK